MRQIPNVDKNAYCWQKGPKMSKLAKHNTVFQVKAFKPFLLLWNLLFKNGLWKGDQIWDAPYFLIAPSLRKSMWGNTHPIIIGCLKTWKLTKLFTQKQTFAKRFYPNVTKINLNDQCYQLCIFCTMRKLHNVLVQRKYLKYSYKHF